ncbi:hypothetical protein [Pseudomonas sp. WS 5410]|uniref:hypothetical protein n=1 Tax=Pseudomonas sp. WS 5410 TaxID=2717485 RepID=UPI0014762EB9|nr:hypothetical protein [Pseudomonas sp. WS 5410]NMY23545.1 hypothetical protein [Pseudomonas sp. WS 5410]
MIKKICSEAKDLEGRSLWVIAPDGSIFISALAAKGAAISISVKSFSRQIS